MKREIKMVPTGKPRRKAKRRGTGDVAYVFEYIAKGATRTMALIGPPGHQAAAEIAGLLFFESVRKSSGTASFKSKTHVVRGPRLLANLTTRLTNCDV